MLAGRSIDSPVHADEDTAEMCFVIALLFVDLLPELCRNQRCAHLIIRQPLTRSARNIVSSQVLDRSSWRTRYVSPSSPFTLKYR